MDIAGLEKFFDYQPFMWEDPQVLVDEIIRKAQEYLPVAQIPLIQKAYNYAKAKHAWQKRLSGEAYIVHPIRATQFLMQISPDIETIQTCILHDVIEDCNVSQRDIEKVFGNEVGALCEGMVKVSKVKYKWEDRHLETLKKTFLAMARDLRVIFVKLADRIHNIQTLQYHPNPAKRKNIANETLKIYVAIAKRLGLFYYQLYLENGSFKILDEESFTDIFGYLKKYFGEGEKYTEKGIAVITNLLQKEDIHDFVIKWRIKSPYRIFEKLEKRYKTTEIASVMDLMAYRIITKTVSDCYMVLGIIHKYYTPLIKKIKDYIAVPKFNGYQSIHTTVLWMFSFPTEIQIRTYQMDDIAEYGVAAHFAYSEHNQPVKVSDQQSQWIKKLQEIVQSYQSLDDREQFKKDLNIEILDKRIYLYTPQWDVIELPTGSTVLDFAFTVHSDIWLRFNSAIVNGEIKPISYMPQTWDVIKINIFKNKYSANKHRLDFLHTSSAKTNLTKFLKYQQKDQLILQASNELNRQLKLFSLPLLSASGNLIKQKYTKAELDKKMLSLLWTKDGPSELIKEFYPKQFSSQKNQIQKAIPSSLKQEGEEFSSVIVDGDQLLNYFFCHDCKPQIGEKLIAKTGRDGIKIHSINCRALKTIVFDKLMEAHRTWDCENMYRIQVEIKISSRSGNLLGLMKVFSELSIIILQVSMKNLLDGSSLVTFETELSNPSRMAFLLNSLKKYDDSLKVNKKRIA